MKKILLVGLSLLMACPTFAKIKLPALVGSNMVLQREREVNLWGEASPSKKVTVTTSWDGRKYATQSDSDGKWLLKVSTPAAGGPYTIRISDGDPVTLENVMIGRHCRTRAGIWGALTRNARARREEQESIDISYSLLEAVHLQDLWNEKACNLAYGAQRRLEIARALATEPRMLLLDEPAAGMNPQESIELMHFIQAIRDHFDLTILLIEHDMKVVMGVCRYIWVMEYGALIAHGDPDAIRSNPEVIRAYLGEDVV